MEVFKKPLINGCFSKKNIGNYNMIVNFKISKNNASMYDIENA